MRGGLGQLPLSQRVEAGLEPLFWKFCAPSEEWESGEKVFETDKLICFKDDLKVMLFISEIDLKFLYTAYSCHQFLKIFQRLFH